MAETSAPYTDGSATKEVLGKDLMTRAIAGTKVRSISPYLLAVVLAASVLMRIAVAFYMGNTVSELPGIFDQISYHNLALRILSGHGFSFGELWWPVTPANAPTAHWSFLYTMYVAGAYRIFGPYPLIARLFQAVIVGVLHPYLAYRIAFRLFGRMAGYVTAGMTASYIYYIYYSGALMTEAFYITSILSTLALSMALADSRQRNQEVRLGIMIGISIGIAVLLRQVFLLFVPFLFLWVWMARLKRNGNPPIAATISSVVMLVVLIAPVTLYNQARFGHTVLLNTNSGYAFFWGNHPIYGTRFIPILPNGTYQDLIPPEIRNLDEAALDGELLHRGLLFVLDDPKRYFLLSLSRIPSYFMFWPSADSGTLSNISRICSFGITWPFMAYGLILSARKSISETRRGLSNLMTSPAGLLMEFAGIYSTIHLLTWALIRYRLPVDAVLIPFAALAAVDIVQRTSLLRSSRERYSPL